MGRVQEKNHPKFGLIQLNFNPLPPLATIIKKFAFTPLTSHQCGVVVMMDGLWSYYLETIFFLVEANWNRCSFLNKLHRFHQKANLWQYDGCIMRRHGPDPNQLLWKSDRSPLGHFPLLIGGLHNYQSLTSHSNEDLWIDGVKNARVLPRWSFEFKPRKDLTWAAI